MAEITHNDPVVTESKLTEFYNDIKPFLGCPAYLTSEGNAEYYSTTEKVIGRWTDGKPLYQKSFTFSNVTISSTQTNIGDISEIPIENGWVESVFANEVDDYFYGLGFISVWLRVDPTDHNFGIKYTFSGQTTVVKSLVVTIRYTKSTDSAATTIEQKPTHYSTDEQVVGTWIDGKPVYQKTYISNTNFNRKTNVVIDTIANVDNVTNCFGYIINVLDDNRLFIGYSGGVNLSMLTTGALRIYSDGWDCKGYRVTIQYTKTTD